MGEGSLKSKIGQQWLIAKWCIQYRLRPLQNFNSSLKFKMERRRLVAK